MKDKLLNSLGYGGLLLYWALTSIFVFAPLLFLGWPFWIDLLVMAVILFVPVVGSIVQFFMWALSVPAVLSGPFDVFTILYCCALAAYVLAYLLPAIAQMVSVLLSRKE